MIVKLLTEHHLEFLSLKGGCRGSSKYTLVKMSNSWKSHAAAQFSVSLSRSTKKQIKRLFCSKIDKRFIITGIKVGLLYNRTS